MPELRTAVMIVVEASWQGADEVWHTASGRIEDKSPGGACIRFKKPVEVGTKLRIESRFEQFAGVVRYCRAEGRDFVVGVQRDNSLLSTVPRPGALLPPADPAVRSGEIERLASHDAPTQLSPATTPVPAQRSSVTTGSAAAAPAHAGRKRDIRDWRRVSRRKAPSSAGHAEMRVIEVATEKEPRRQSKTMKRKWIDLAPWSKKQGERMGEASFETIPETAMEENPTATIEEERVMSSPTQSTEKSASREVPNFQVELLPMEDVFRLAGISSPRRGYSVSKVIEMINSEHVRGLSKEMKRAAVLMALDAAGVSIDQIQRDAKARQDALDAYEASQKKQAEAEWVRKSEEISQIQSELESIRAHYTARISRCTEALARDKARFNTWVTTKEQESKSMAEAVELCLKPSTADVGTAPLASAAAVAGESTGVSGPKP